MMRTCKAQRGLGAGWWLSSQGLLPIALNLHSGDQLLNKIYDIATTLSKYHLKKSCPDLVRPGSDGANK
jgi:hypothetical protein